MPTDTDYDPRLHPHGPPAKHRVKFDPTINLGHLITFVGFLIGGFSVYSNFDKRQTVQELQSTAIEKRVAEQDLRLERALEALRTDSKETQRVVQGINERLVILQVQKGAKP